MELYCEIYYLAERLERLSHWTVLKLSETLQDWKKKRIKKPILLINRAADTWRDPR